jgi:hypothetical protein
MPICAADCTRALTADETADGAVICARCAHRVGAWLAELPNQIVVLEASRQRETSGESGGGRTVHRTAPLPGRPDVLNLLGAAAWRDGIRDPYGDARADQHGPLPIAGVLIPWVRLVSEERRWNPPATLTPQALAAWLAHPQALAWAVRRPWAGEMCDELHSMMRTVWGITRLRPRRRAVAQPCPRCESLTLVETDHQLYVDCTTCEAMFSRGELALGARITVAALNTDAA